MKISRFAVLVGMVGLSSLGWGQVPSPAPLEDNDQQEVLTRGPVHEAFAEAISYDPQPGPVVPKAPPAPIEEIPPDQKPEGSHVTWVSGYWAWDDERNDYLWVSGIWRDLPPERTWVAGSWNSVNGGYQWTPGYWAQTTQPRAQYRSEPPATLEAGPNIAAPSDEDAWVPGNWMWTETRYVWRPGYWQPCREEWVWVPAHYVWTPRGYLFVEGYWDYEVSRRGILFAPVYFRHVVYRPCTPVIVINVDLFDDCLFVRPRYCHYYFGDYYEPRYATVGIFASFSFSSGRRGYDPIFVHSRWRNRHNPNWERQVQADFQNRRQNAQARPARTFAAQNQREKNSPNQKSASLGVPLNQISDRSGSKQRLQKVSSEERQQLAQEAKVTREKNEELKKQASSDSDQKKQEHRQDKENNRAAKGEPAPGSPTKENNSPSSSQTQGRTAQQKDLEKEQRQQQQELEKQQRQQQKQAAEESSKQQKEQSRLQKKQTEEAEKQQKDQGRSKQKLAEEPQNEPSQFQQQEQKRQRQLLEQQQKSQQQEEKRQQQLLEQQQKSQQQEQKRQQQLLEQQQQSQQQEQRRQQQILQQQQQSQQRQQQLLEQQQRQLQQAGGGNDSSRNTRRQPAPAPSPLQTQSAPPPKRAKENKSQTETKNSDKHSKDKSN